MKKLSTLMKEVPRQAGETDAAFAERVQKLHGQLARAATGYEGFNQVLSELAAPRRAKEQAAVDLLAEFVLERLLERGANSIGYNALKAELEAAKVETPYALWFLLERGGFTVTKTGFDGKPMSEYMWTVKA